MAKVKKNKLKRPVKIAIVLLILVFIGVMIPVGYKMYHTNKLEKLGYNKKAITNILKEKQQNYIYKVGKNKTLNKAFESGEYKTKYLKSYEKIPYQNQKDLIKNINILLDKEYSVAELTAILKSGNNKTVSEFAGREKVDDVLDYMKFDFARLENYDRYVAYQQQEREDEENTVTYVNLNLDKEFYTDSILITEYSETVLANKYRKLGEEYVPDNLMKIDRKYSVDDEQSLTKVATEAFEKMAKAAEEEGFYILANSAYRSYQDQQETYNVYKNEYGQNYVDNYVALPGYSEHQTGLALDVKSKDSNIFAESDEFDWMQKNSYKYGFIMRYPKDKQNVTGYKYESWHYRYVGVEIATYIYENNLTYDEYYIRFLDK